MAVLGIEQGREWVSMYTYIAKVLGKIEYPPRPDYRGVLQGVMNGLHVGVFRLEDGQEEQVGEYERNFPVLYNTFFHFVRDGRDYALYARQYNATRVMELPSCKDIGGEEPHIIFCPLDYYVPSYIEVEVYNDQDQTTEVERVNEPSQNWMTPYTTTVSASALGKEYHLHYKPRPQRHFHAIGFVAGRNWAGGPFSLLQYLDLSEVHHGIIRRDSRFGHIELPDWMSLRETIHMLEYQTNPEDPKDSANHVIGVAVQQLFYMPDLEPKE